jgi:hypothetical protein
MVHDVFISFATEDRAVAHGICVALEAEGIACWIASRDIPPGAEYKEAIVTAIEHSGLLLLVFSAYSNGSRFVEAEVDRAFTNGLPILPFRLQEIAPNKNLELVICGPHWLEAWKAPWGESLPTLIGAVRSLLAARGRSSGAIRASPQEAPERVLADKRNEQPGRDLARRPGQEFVTRGYATFADRQIEDGIDKTIEEWPEPPPLGPLPIGSKSYVMRSADNVFRAALARHDSIVLVRGTRQVGKTSLLARGLQAARDGGAAVVITDLQMLNRPVLQSPETLYHAWGAEIDEELGLDARIEDVWGTDRAPNANFGRYLRRVLETLNRPLVWAIDEVDYLFTFDYRSEVFGLFRSWHNARAMKPAGPWGRLTLVLAHATEAHLFITDVNQSPFNVGTQVALEDFAIDQVADLNHRYGSPLRDDKDLDVFHRLVEGHPYLVNRGLYEMSVQRVGVPTFAARAGRDEGPFGDHLRRIVRVLKMAPDLHEVVRCMLRDNSHPDSKSFYPLRAAGLLKGDSGGDARFRCQLYESYLKKHLP